MTPDITPSTEEIASFATPNPAEPPSLDEDEIIQHLDETLSLTSTDIKSDPILRSIAKQQSQTRLSQDQKAPSTSGTANFKARPAPRVLEGAGPRMTRAAALRQGLPWDSLKVERKEEVVSTGMPGHKRAGRSIVSLRIAFPLKIGHRFSRQPFGSSETDEGVLSPHRRSAAHCAQQARPSANRSRR